MKRALARFAMSRLRAQSLTSWAPSKETSSSCFGRASPLPFATGAEVDAGWPAAASVAEIRKEKAVNERNI